MRIFLTTVFLSGLLLLIAGLTVPLHAQDASFEEAWEETRRAFEQKLDDEGIVGGALLFLERGAVKGSSYYGLADIEGGRAVDANTIFHWASITKTFTAIAIMQLRDRGLLSLDDPLTMYLPELRDIHNPYGSMDEITIRMALDHSTGLRSPTWPWGGSEDWHPFEPTEWEQLVAMFPYTNIEFEPGSRYSYSNPAIIFLGRIIEILTGDPYVVAVQKSILRPLGMDASYYDTTPEFLLPQRSNSYILREEELDARGLDFDTGITTSNGGLNAPMADMIKYLAFLTDEPIEHHILDRASLEAMWEPRHVIEEEEGRRSSVGLSFFIEEFDGMRLIGHTGTQHSFYSFFYIHPESGTACIGVTNTDGDPEMYRFREEVTRMVVNNLFDLYR